MTTIRETLEAAAPEALHNYGHVVGKVEVALLEREYTLTDAIVEGVVHQFGVSEEQVKSRLGALGASLRPEPEPEPEPELELPVADEDGGVSKGKGKKRVKALEEKVDKLADAVANLTDLAQRHLGVRL